MNPHEDGRKRGLHATVVKVLRHRRTERGMSLEPHASRCVRPGEVHELVATDHTETAPGARIDRVGFLGFAEITAAGVLDRGDEVWIGPRRVGTARRVSLAPESIECRPGLRLSLEVLVHANVGIRGRDEDRRE